MSGWTSQEEYEALHGTQEEQAKKQVVATADADGPYRLCLQTPQGKTILPNSVRSTRAEIDRLREDEYARTGRLWAVETYERGGAA